MERIIGEYGQSNQETLILCIAGLHGNEPAGIQAFEAVMHELHRRNPPFSAKLLGLRGNLAALKAKKRYVQEDLNRIWEDETIRLARTKSSQKVEIKELAEIFSLLDALDFARYRQKIFIDLHTTSAPGGSFVIATDFEKSRYLVEHFSMPIILGLEEQLKNTAIQYMHDQGFLTYACEGGQHEDKRAIRHLSHCLWKTFYRSECLDKQYIPGEFLQYQDLDSFNERVPRILDLVYLHRVKPHDAFEMKPGYKNFDWIEEGEIVARDRQGFVRAPKEGYMLMPLYQKEGDDGFFLVQPFEEVV